MRLLIERDADELLTPFPLSYYRIFSANCAGTEEE